MEFQTPKIGHIINNIKYNIKYILATLYSAGIGYAAWGLLGLKAILLFFFLGLIFVQDLLGVYVYVSVFFFYIPFLG